jgi:phosphoglycerate dehydrogenase-like enzyme
VRVLLTEGAARVFGPRLVADHPGIELVAMGREGVLSAGDGTPIDRTASGIEVAWATTDLYHQDRELVRPFFGLVRRCETLRWFQSAAAGYDAPIFAELIKKGVLFTKSDVHSIPIAEYVLRAALDHFQEPQRWVAAQAQRQWEGHEFRELWGSTWVIVGFGSIGAEVAQRVRAFGARAVGVRRRPTGHEPADEMVTPTELLEVLPGADVVALCAPANPTTEHLVDRRFLAAMKPSALLINIGRGSVVDERALVAALDAGELAAAVLDVFETEPLPPDSPLWSHPKVTVTPHDSANSNRRVLRQFELFTDNLGRFRRSEPLRNVVTVDDLW